MKKLIIAFALCATQPAFAATQVDGVTCEYFAELVGDISRLHNEGKTQPEIGAHIQRSMNNSHERITKPFVFRIASLHQMIERVPPIRDPKERAKEVHDLKTHVFFKCKEGL